MVSGFKDGWVLGSSGEKQFDHSAKRNYRVIRGGNAATIDVLTKDLQVGDIAVDIGRPAGLGKYLWDDYNDMLCEHWTVAAIQPTRIVFSSGSSERLSSEVLWRVKRSGASKKVDSLWNGTCQKCKGNIYTSALFVEHERPCQ